MIKNIPATLQPASGRIPRWIYEAIKEAEQGAEPGELAAATIQPRYPGTSRELLTVMRTRDFVEHFKVEERSSREQVSLERGR